MNTMDEKIEELGKQFAFLQKKLEEQKNNGGKQAEDVITHTRQEIERLSKRMKARCEEGKDAFSSDLINAQQSLKKRKEELRIQLEERLTEQKKRKAEAEVEAAADYAQAAMEFALLALDEATLAFYEAVEKAETYNQQYED